ncbi:MAG: bifunctional oligoribonuclease/PAP phosphatase NrnA [Candidatus Aureabacteria bacterium]|nr:bifunctional oligoribonuclease/PAP phosphatase NrnA [Candidatus Auribacterota bacterium]
MHTWREVRSVIAHGRIFAVVSHVYPDGDAIGSMVALLRLLSRMGKAAQGILPCPIPSVYRFLAPSGDIRAYRPGLRNVIAGADAVFILDSSTDDRLGALFDLINSSGKKRICIDHHPGNSVHAEIKVVDTKACSTSQMIYELYGVCGKPVDLPAALAISTGIHTDTVSFNFLGTTARTHEIAADLLRRGVDAKQTWLHIYGNDSPRLLQLAGRTLSVLCTADGGRIAWIAVRERDWKALGIHPRDTESFTRYPLTIRDVGVIILFCEEGKRRVRVSLRALDRTDVGAIARALGGGGHSTSAGVTLHEPLSRVIPRVIKALRRRNR